MQMQKGCEVWNDSMSDATGYNQVRRRTATLSARIKGKIVPSDEQLFYLMWHDVWLERCYIAAFYGMSVQWVKNQANRLGYPNTRELLYHAGMSSKSGDPSPEEIQELCREIRNKHLQEKKGSSYSPNGSTDYGPSTNIREYVYRKAEKRFACL